MFPARLAQLIATLAYSRVRFAIKEEEGSQPDTAHTGRFKPVLVVLRPKPAD